jgi:hypothetical protein
MAITAAGLAGGAFADDTTSVSRNMGSVTAGQLIVVGAGKYSPSTDAFVAGDCTKSAGTATIGTVTLARTDGGSTGTGAFAHTGIWWAICTGSGTLTMQVGGAVAGSYLHIGAEAFNGNWDAASEEAENGALNTGNAITALGTGNATSAGAALFVGVLALNTSNNTAINPDGAFTTIFESEDGTAHAVGSSIYRIVGTGTTDAADWTFTALSGAAGDGGCCTLAVFKEAAGGGGTTGRGRLVGGKLVGGNLLVRMH